MTNSDSRREAFEKFITIEFHYYKNGLDKYDDGTYINMSIQNYWEVFQAGCKENRKNKEELTETEQIWLKKSQYHLLKCPSKRLGFYCIGGREIVLFDANKYPEIHNLIN
ncbi:hypothetical protein [Xenorhabdus hominickii]|uniref:Uncharacterized protein n=1 Tax=Xenorhabdus hominickii TaxID=351679 RepID=A0A2G0PWK5_XENHO|nr:hypothetical protein [Xenorhabdus hominickii]AOM39259.1 hypothetical protein A9255_00675 [Xenorhabdus hominickii]PHM51335.1 hypothetical protein Xhom_04946 [Xenorhabdus hominickii]PHM55001.1 hypothetical protein Xhom_02971 [Xenorhabdus hominickii]